MENYLVAVKTSDNKILYIQRLSNKEILLEKIKCHIVDFIYENEYNYWLEQYI